MGAAKNRRPPVGGAYVVVCGNIGTVYRGPDETKARRIYAEYADLSIRRYGRASDEPVTLLLDGEVLFEHLPAWATADDDDDDDGCSRNGPVPPDAEQGGSRNTPVSAPREKG
jgi:hypothetical protein